METLEEIRTHYSWSEEDEENLNTIAWIGERFVDEFLERFYNLLDSFKDAQYYLSDEKVRKRHREKIRSWFVGLFKSRYDAEYIRKLRKIGEVHAKIGLPPHYVQASMSLVRDFLEEKISAELECNPEREKVMRSLHKALDLNLDVIISSSRDEELKRYRPTGKYQRVLIENIRRISWFFDAFIILTLFFVGLSLIAWIVYELWLIATGGMPLERGGLSILGSALILYAVSELLTEEIKHVRGAAVSLKVFVGVALAALIRKVLIVSLSPEKAQELITLSVTVLALGAVFWLIHRVEREE